MRRPYLDTVWQSCAIQSMVILLLLVTFPLDRALAAQAITFDSGVGLDNTQLLRLNLSVDNSQRKPAVQEDWSWNLSWEANLSYWYLRISEGGEKDLFELGVTPNVRLERDWASAWGRPYLEAGLGIHLLSNVHIGPRNLSSALQFGSHAGFGIRFGRHEEWDLALRYEHLSNGGLQEPNPGINFAMVRFGYHW